MKSFFKANITELSVTSSDLDQQFSFQQKNHEIRSLFFHKYYLLGLFGDWFSFFIMLLQSFDLLLVLIFLVFIVLKSSLSMIV